MSGMTWWKRGQRDPVAEQLGALERQGAGMAGLAHLAAFALVIVFSAGSLVALSGEALAHLIATAQRGAVDVPSAISIAVSTLLVCAMDVALVYAAASVRLLRLRRADGAGWHIAVIIGVSLVEAATYLDMGAQYDRPDTWAVWALLAARAISAPLVAVYLSLARTLPVSARDIVASVELATGRGVVRDMTAIAADPAAPLERKLSLYRASSVMTAADAARLEALIAAERATRLALPAPQAPQPAQDGASVGPEAQPGVDATPASAATGEPPTASPDGPQTTPAAEADTSYPPDEPPPGGGGVRTPPERRARHPAILRLTPATAEPRPAARRRGLGSYGGGTNGRSHKGVRTPLKTTASREADARRAWAEGARTVQAMVNATKMSRNAAGGWVRALKAEAEQPGERHAAQ